MAFSAESILLALFTGVIAALASYFGAYSKVKAEVRAATEDLRQTVENLRATTRAVELEKSKIATDSALAAEQRKAIYALATAMQMLTHSMCWLSWDVKTRNTVRPDVAKAYDSEAHKILPEVFSQLALLRILDVELHSRAYPYASQLAALDVKFGEAIVVADRDVDAAIPLFESLFVRTNELQYDIDSLFGGKLKVLSPASASSSLAKDADA